MLDGVTPLTFVLELFFISIAAGVLGSLLGLGGGIIVIPALTLLFHVDIRLAIGASIVSVIATSSGAAAAYVRERITNMRVGMFLEIATTTGAVTGAYIEGLVSAKVLYVVFAVVLGYSALAMFRKRSSKDTEHVVTPVPKDRLADWLSLHDSYYDEAEKREIGYQVTHTPLGLGFMYIAGAVSGLLGIGSGALKVPAMDLAMRLPMKVSTATSNFMIGVTAAASAGVYLFRGDIDPLMAAPVAAGVLMGATGGSRVLPRLHNEAVRGIFVAVLVFISVEMLLKGIA
ncbi:MAG: sulfite exporter TauE/SafE family protein [Acidimicrobiales bacterium]|jgi:hypothetical protein